MDCVATEKEDLYRCRQPDEFPVPILVMPVAVEDKILVEEEVAQAVWGLKRGRSGGPLGMRVEDLKGWLREASRETNTVTH